MTTNDPRISNVTVGFSSLEPTTISRLPLQFLRVHAGTVNERLYRVDQILRISKQHNPQWVTVCFIGDSHEYSIPVSMEDLVAGLGLEIIGYALPPPPPSPDNTIQAPGLRRLHDTQPPGE